MEKKVLFLSSGISFMVNAMDNSLQEAGYKLIHIGPSIEEINAHRDDADLYLFYLGKFVSEISDVLVYLKDICTEEEKLLLVIGNPTELAAVEEYIPLPTLAAAIERPLNIKNLITEMDYLVQANDDIARRKNILLVDDDPAYLKMIKSWLSLKYRVTIVTSGAQALMYIADNIPDLILLDYDMPVTSGPQHLEMIRHETKVEGIPVIFLTGQGPRDSVLNVLALKPDGYLLKSMEQGRLEAAIDAFFEKRKYESLHDNCLKS